MGENRKGKGHQGKPAVPKRDEPVNNEHRTVRERLKHGWDEFLDFAIPFLFDVAKGTLIILALFFFAWLLSFGRALGIKEERIEAFETIDFWAQVGTYSMVSLAFFRRLYRSIKSEM